MSAFLDYYAPPSTGRNNEDDELPGQPVVSDFNDIERALLGTEGSGRDAVSKAGARGSMQIMPGTFKQYAQEGESFDNEEHRVAAARRKIADDYAWAQAQTDDPEKQLGLTFAAYQAGRGGASKWFNGRGNEVNDGILNVNQYVERARSKYGKTAALPASQVQAAGTKADDSNLSLIDSFLSGVSGPDRSRGESVRMDATPGQEEDTGIINEGWKGLKRGTDILQATAYGAAGVVGDKLLESDAVRDWGMEGYQRNIEEAGHNAAAIGKVEDIGGLGDFTLWAAGALGEVAPMFVPGLGTAALGARAAGGLATRALAGYAEKTIASKTAEFVAAGMARDVAQATAQKVVGSAVAKVAGNMATIGAGAGGYASSAAQEIGSIYGDIYDQTGKYDADGAIAYGATAALLDALPTTYFAKKLGLTGAAAERAQAIAKKSLLREAGKGLLKGGSMEAITEGAQTAIENEAVLDADPTKGEAPFSDKWWSNIGNAAAMGAVGGGAMGAASDALAARKNNKELAASAIHSPAVTPPAPIPGSPLTSAAQAGAHATAVAATQAPVAPVASPLQAAAAAGIQPVIGSGSAGEGSGAPNQAPVYDQVDSSGNKYRVFNSGGVVLSGEKNNGYPDRLYPPATDPVADYSAAWNGHEGATNGTVNSSQEATQGNAGSAQAGDSIAGGSNALDGQLSGAEPPVLGDAPGVAGPGVRQDEPVAAAGTTNASVDDPMYQSAVDVVRGTHQPAVSTIQRHLRIGYNRAARIFEAMQAEGVVTVDADGMMTVVDLPTQGVTDGAQAAQTVEAKEERSAQQATFADVAPVAFTAPTNVSATELDQYIKPHGDGTYGFASRPPADLMAAVRSRIDELEAGNAVPHSAPSTALDTQSTSDSASVPTQSAAQDASGAPDGAVPLGDRSTEELRTQLKHAQAGSVRRAISNELETRERNEIDTALKDVVKTASGEPFKTEAAAKRVLPALGTGYAVVPASELHPKLKGFVVRKVPVQEQIEQAREETNTAPTEAQIEAENYKKGRLTLHGFDIAIENPKGSIRSGTSPDGKQWQSVMKADYGHFTHRKADGADGDKVDVFIGPAPESQKVFVIDQKNADGSFDEHKVMFGYLSDKQAKAGYLAQYEKGWQGFGAITEMSLDQFNSWLKSDRTMKPVAYKAPAANITAPVEPTPDMQERYATSVQKYNALVGELKQATSTEQKAAIKLKMDALDHEQAAIKSELSRMALAAGAAERRSEADKTFGAMAIGTRIGFSEHPTNDNIYWEKTGSNEWTRHGIGSSIVTKASAEMEQGRVIQRVAKKGIHETTKEEDAAASVEKTPKTEQVVPDVSPEPEKTNTYGADNKLVSAERAAILREKLKKKLNGSQLNSGIDPEILAAGAELAVFHIEAGARSFAKMAKAIAADLDMSLDKLKPYLRSWYNGARDMMEDGGVSIDGMDDADQVRAELANLTDEPAKAAETLPNATAPEHVDVGVNDKELGQVVKEFKAAQASEGKGDEQVTHVFDAPKKGDVIRLNDKVKVYHAQHGWMTPAEARALIDGWKAHAQAQGENTESRNINSQKVVLSLFDLTGKWSKPWEEAGYQVFRFDIQDDPEVGDVHNFSSEFFGDWFGDFEGQDIHAILAACPCTDFASSGARHFAAKDADGRTVSSVKLVHQTLATIEYFKPAVWAIENPVGRIEDLGGLPPWRLSFDPNHLGDPYTKKTLLWGRFNGDLPIAPVEPTEGSKMHKLYGGKSQATKNARSATPEGFSYGFFMANNFIDNQAMSIANKYDRLDRKLIERAVSAGVTEEQINNAVEDFYYMDLDDEAANEAVRDLIAEAKQVDSQQEKQVDSPEAHRRSALTALNEGKTIEAAGLTFEQDGSLTNVMHDGVSVAYIDGPRTRDKLIRVLTENLKVSPDSTVQADATDIRDSRIENDADVDETRAGMEVDRADAETLRDWLADDMDPATGKPIHSEGRRQELQVELENLDSAVSQAGEFLANTPPEATQSTEKQDQPEKVSTGKAETGSEIVRYASGMSSIGDLTNGTYARSGHKLSGIGVDVGEVSKNGIKQLAHAILNWRVPVFIDSGAFSAFRKSLKGEFTPVDFDKVLAKYESLIEAIASQNDVEETDYPRPLLVMPDVVGDQSTSLSLIERYQPAIKMYAATNLAKPIIPLQRGDLSLADAYAFVKKTLGTDDFIVGLPSNAEALTADEIGDFLKTSKPKAVHFLGAAADSRLQPFLDLVEEHSPKTVVTADASQVRSKILNMVKDGLARPDAISAALSDSNDPGVARDLASDTKDGGNEYAEKWFGGKPKATAYIVKNKLMQTHEAQLIDKQWRIVPKAKDASDVAMEKLATEDSKDDLDAALTSSAIGWTQGTDINGDNTFTAQINGKSVQILQTGPRSFMVSNADANSPSNTFRKFEEAAAAAETNANKSQVGAGETAAKQPAEKPGVVTLPGPVSSALQAGMEKQKRRTMRLRTESEAEGLNLEQKLAAQTKVKAADTTLRAMRTGIFAAEDAAVKALASKDISAFAEHEMLFPEAKEAIAKLLGGRVAAEESDQDRSMREWTENYDRVANTDDLSTVSTVDLERAENWAASKKQREQRKGWDGDDVNSALINALTGEIDRIKAEVARRKPSAKRINPGEPGYTLAMADADLDAMLAQANKNGIIEDDRLNERIKRQEKLIDEMRAESASPYPAEEQRRATIDASGKTRAEAIQALQDGQRIKREGTTTWIEETTAAKVQTYVIKSKDDDSDTIFTKGPAGPDRQWGWGKLDAAQKAVESWSFSDEVAENQSEPNLAEAKVLLAKQKAATGNKRAEVSVRGEIRALAAKTPVSDEKTVLALDMAATRLDMDSLSFADARVEVGVASEPEADATDFDSLLDSVLDAELGAEPEPAPKSGNELLVERMKADKVKMDQAREAGSWAYRSGQDRLPPEGLSKNEARAWLDAYDNAPPPDSKQVFEPKFGPTEAPEPRSAGKAAASAVKNAGSGMLNAAKGLNALFAPKPGTLGSGPVFNEDTYAAAKPYFQMAIADLKSAGTDIKEMVVALVRGLVANGLDRAAIKGMSPYLERFVKETVAGYDQTKEVVPDDSTEQGSADSVDSGVAEVRPGDESEVAGGSGATGAAEGRVDDGNLRGTGGRVDVSDEYDRQPSLFGDGEGGSVEHGATRELASSAGAVLANPDFIPGRGGLTREGSWYDTAKRNVDLIELARKIDSEGRAATPDEQEQLSKYVGFGAGAIRNPLFPIPGQWAKQQNPSRLIWSNLITDARWRALGERLEELPIEWQKSVLQSTQYAHYTSEGIVRSVWGAIERLGFTGGQVFEPGMGIGSFAMLMPEQIRKTSRYSGVEFDGPTALIAKLLSPQQNMMHDDFIKRKFPKGFFDVAIGNPPFSQTQIFGDPDYQKHGFMLHDFFFAKSIDSVRPGGLLAFVTSKGTMDKQTDKARKYLSARADLIGAIRLPSTAFEDNAGTSVVTDVIFLRKRAEGEAPAGQPWGKVATIETKDGPVVVNEYFAAHPEMVLGQQRISGNTDDMGRRISSNGRGGEKYTVVSYDSTPAELDAKFAEAVKLLPANVYSVLSQSTESVKKETAKIDFDPSVRREGVVYVAKDGTVMRVEGGVGKALDADIKLSDKDKAWFKDYVKLRDLIQAARQSQLNDGDWEADIKKLNKAHDAFTKTHGPLKKFVARSRKTTDEEGNVKETTWRIYDNKRLYQEDYDQSIVMQLEDVTEAGEIVKGPFLKGRTIGAPVVRDVRSVGDALAVSLDEHGSLDLSDISHRMGLSVADTIEALGGQVYQTMDGSWQLADEYLSGNVVAKLEEAEQAARLNPALMRNVEALKAVQPDKLGPSQISAKLGAAWLPVDHVNEFAKEIEAGAVSFDPVTESWQVDGANLRSQRQAGAEYGTAKRSPSELLEAALNSRAIKIMQTVDKKTVVDEEGTTAAAQAIKKIKDKFKSWVWTDSDRATELVEAYNHRYNNIAGRKFDGSHLTLPGVSLRFKLHPHQLRAIWRIIQTGNTYLAHAVGSGKTIEMIAAGMEQKRLGLIKKPIYVVPNHMLEQFSNEFMELYPLANIMVADDENFSAERRRAFIAAATMNNPDAVIITHDAFQRIGVKEETVGPIRDEILNDLQEELAAVAKDSGARVRRGQLEQQIEAITQRFDRIINAGGKDSTIKFEDIGADFVFYDEAHAARKLDFHTAQQIKGIDPNGSKRAMDMYIKTRWLESKRPGRSMVFASGTPVTNTMGELYTIMRFFAQDELDRAGISTFDSWSRMFGEVASALEPNAAGKYELIERFAKFDNVPELMSRVRQFMDVLTSEHLGSLVKRPDLEGGKPNLNIVEPTEALTEYMQGELARRIEISKAWKPSKDEPNNPDPIVAIITDGRFAAIDPRFFGQPLPEGEESIITAMGAKVVANYKATKNNVYLDKDKKPEPLKGGTQMVFYNLGFGAQSQKSRGFNSKDAFTKVLTDGGIPRNEIAWFDDANTDAKKEAIFKDMRSGKLRVLIGSAKKMGTGVNVQKRLTNLHYQDPPWFPSDVEQPHGRIIRQGNQNGTVGIDWYTTKGTYQSTMWQMVARKQRFIDQAFAGDKSMRTMEDMGEASLFEQAAAVASGDPRALQLAGLRQDVERFERLQAAHASEQINAKSALRSAEWWAESASNAIERFSKAYKDIGERYVSFVTGKVGGVNYDKQGEFGTALKAAFNQRAANAALDPSQIDEATIATLGDKVSLVMEGLVDSKNKFTNTHSLSIAVGDLRLNVVDGAAGLGQDVDDVGLTRRIMNVINGIETSLRKSRADLETQNNDIRRLKKKLGAPFEYQQDLAEKYGDLKRLEAELEAEGKVKAPIPVVIANDGTIDGEPAADGSATGESAPGLYWVTSDKGERESAPRQLSDDSIAQLLGHGWSIEKVDDSGGAMESRGDYLDTQPAFYSQLARAIEAAPAKIDNGSAIPNSVSPADIRAAWVQTFGAKTVRQLEAKGLIHIVATAADLPPGVEMSATARASWNGDRAWFIADRMTPAMAHRELLHEIGEHAGLERMLGADGYDSLMQQIKTLRTSDPLVAEAWAKVKRDYDEVEGGKRFMQEVMAKLGELADVQKKPFWQQMIATVRRWLIQHFGFTGMLKISDLQELVMHSLKTMARPDGNGPRGGQPIEALASNKDKYEFVHHVLEALAFDSDLFRYPTTKAANLVTAMRDVFPGATYLGDLTRTDERQESGADRRDSFQTADTKNAQGELVPGKQFDVFTTRDRVWVDVHRLQPGDQGSRIYSAVADFAFNSRRVFRGDPAGVSPDAIIARNKMILSSALKHGTTRHLEASKEQQMGVPGEITELTWGPNEVENVRDLIHTIITTHHRLAPSIKDYRYDFAKRQFTKLGEHDAGTASILADLSSNDANRAKAAIGRALGDSQRRAAGIGADSGRAAILIQSLVSPESERVGNGGILEAALNHSGSLIDSGLRGLFSQGDYTDTVNFWRDYAAVIGRGVASEVSEWLQKAYLQGRGGLFPVARRGEFADTARAGGDVRKANTGRETLFVREPIAGFDNYWTRGRLDQYPDGRRLFNFYVAPSELVDDPDALSQKKYLQQKSLFNFSFIEGEKGKFTLSVAEAEPGTEAYEALESMGRLEDTPHQTTDGGHNYKRVKLDQRTVTMRQLMREAVRRLTVATGSVPTVTFPQRDTGARAGIALERTYGPNEVQAHFSQGDYADAQADSASLESRGDYLDTARDFAARTLSSGPTAKTFNTWWHQTVGTMYHLSTINAPFKKVFDHVQHFMRDTAKLSMKAEALAPELIPTGFRATPINVNDARAIAQPIFLGTLHNHIVSDAEMRAGEFVNDETGEIVEFEALTDDQIRYAHQFRASINQSMEDLGRAELVRGFKSAEVPVGLIDAAMENTTTSEELAVYVIDRIDAIEAADGRGLDSMIRELSDLREERKAIAFENPAKYVVTFHGSPVAEFYDRRDAGAYVAQELTKFDDRNASEYKIDADGYHAAKQALIPIDREIADKQAEVDAAKAWRASAQKVGERVAKAREEGYAPLMRFGKYSLYFYQTDEETGEKVPVYFELFEDETERNDAIDARRAALAEQYDDLEEEIGIVAEQQSSLFDGLTPELAKNFAAAMGMDEDAAFQEYIAKSVNNRSVLKRLLHRKGTAGYSEDSVRVLAAFLTSNSRRASALMHLTDAREASDQIDRKNGDVKNMAENLIDYVANPKEEAGALRGFMFFNFLGGSVASAMVNLTQTVLQTAPYLYQFAKGHANGRMGIAKELARAQRLAGHIVIGETFNRGLPTLASDLQAALDRAADEGVTKPHEVHQLQAAARGQSNSRNIARRLARVTGNDEMAWGGKAEWGMQRFMQGWGSMFGMAEEYNRTTAFIAAYNIGTEQGMAPNQAYDFAAKAVDESQGVYSKASRPMWARGAVGATVFTFKTFSIQYVEFLRRLYKEDKEAFVVALAVLVGMAGIAGLPGMDDLDDIIDTVGQWMGYATNTKKSRREAVEATVGKVLGQVGSDFVLNGISAVLPVDVHARLGLGNLIPGSAMLHPGKTSDQKLKQAFEVIGPVGGLVNNAFTAMERAAKGDMDRAALAIAPSAVRNLAGGIKMAANGYSEDGKGRRVTDVDLWDAGFKMIGLQPSTVSKVHARRAEQDTDKWIYNNMRAEISEQWADGIAHRDATKTADALAKLRAWNRDHPEMVLTIKPKDVMRRAKAMQEDARSRYVKAAPKVMRDRIVAEQEG